MHGCLIWVGGGMDMVSLLVLVRVATIGFLPLSLISSDIQMELFRSFLVVV